MKKQETLFPPKPRIRHNMNCGKFKGESNFPPSITVPDQTYTPQEMMRRYAAGLPFDKLRNFSYHGDIYVPDTRTMDMVEIDEQLDAAKKEVQNQRKLYNEKVEANKQKRKSALQEIIKKAQTELANASV